MDDIRSKDYGFTRMPLHLVDSPPPTPPAFDLAPLDLKRQPTRPGITHTETELQVPSALARTALGIAAVEGLTGPVWIGLVIESERVVEQAGDSEHRAAELCEQLDQIARVPSPPVPGAATRLVEFGKALRAAERQPAQQAAVSSGLGDPTRVSARMPYQAITAWQRAAIERGQRLEAWAAERLQRLPRNRSLWEAAAAERGETLAEWILVHAARR